MLNKTEYQAIGKCTMQILEFCSINDNIIDNLFDVYFTYYDYSLHIIMFLRLNGRK